MAHEKYPASRSGGPFDDSAPERLRRMGLQTCDGEPDQDALPEPVWWLAGNLKLVEQFSQCFIRRLSEFVEECGGGVIMRDVKIYAPSGQLGPLREFLPSLDQKLRQKILRQIARLSQIHLHWSYWRRHVLSVCQI